MHSLEWRRSCVVERRERRYTEKQKPSMVDGRDGESSEGEKREAWKMIEGIRDRGTQPPTGLRHLYGQKKKAARGRWVEHEEYGGIGPYCTGSLTKMVAKKIIFKMARDITDGRRDLNRGAAIKDNNRMLITESKEVLRI